MNLIDFLNSPVANALGWTLLHAVWQGFALVLPIAVVLHALRSRSSSLRYRVGTLTLLTQLLVSAATFLWYYKPLINTTGAKSLAVQTLPIRWQTVVRTLPWHQQMQQFLENHLSQFVLIYLIGVALFGLRLAGGWIYLQRLTKTATKPAATSWMQLTDRLRLVLAIRSVVQVRESARIAVPMVVGVLKPVLLLPIGLITNLTTREIEAVLAHELAHIKRHDYAVNLLQSVVEVLYFFHPALWWLSARVREEREHCCDDLAVQACGGDGRILAQALARVEELRLIQEDSAPALAMAFASKRQHLLHRVRRMLGVPTRPFVSNGSLAGLTLATILLMSMSVYAVQKQDTPKPRISQPHPKSTRTHKIDSNSEYGMVNNQKVSYIIWKGQKLPATRVAKLQRQLNQVMAGQLSLDNVPQADRDILLTIIEKNNSFNEGMGALTNGLSHIDYDNIVASSLKNIPLSPDGTVEGLVKVNYDSIIRNAFASIQTPQFDTDSTVQPDMGDVIRRQDSLLDLRELNKGKIALLKAQAQSQQFAVEAVERKIEQLERQKSVLEQRRFFETTTQQQTIQKSGFARTDSSRVALTKQIEAGELTIQKTETAIDALNHQLINMQSELEKVAKPLRETEAQLQKSYSNWQAFSVPSTVGFPSAPKLNHLDVPAMPARPHTPLMAPRASRPKTIPTPVPKPAMAPKPE
ncbi:M56 family metallopeptidase [Spirosoma flavum]|uniref:M56 family metallopeptidase n=1 Tax=Spirosoma flavum TaxID=2048557 RepID=A0ABW6AUY8_9BACT